MKQQKSWANQGNRGENKIQLKIEKSAKIIEKHDYFCQDIKTPRKRLFIRIF